MTIMQGAERDPPGGVDVWWTRIDEGLEREDAYRLLDDTERSRAGRFRFHRDRVRFVYRRAFLREVLATYTGVEPDQVRLRTTATGKPELDPPSRVSFNSSHSDGLAVVAVTRERLVGVDIERIRPVPDAIDIASRYFSRRERERIRGTASAALARAFLTLWTRKESYAKAIGGGLSIPFEGFDVSAADHAGAGRPRTSEGTLPFAFASWRPVDGFVGAITVSGNSVVPREMTRVTQPARPLEPRP